MIYESIYWKEELYRNAKWLVEALSKKRWNNRSFAKLEKCLMLSAYSLRKLSESKKTPPKFMDKMIRISYYPRIKDSSLDIFNNHKLERHYRLDKRKETNISVRTLLNQVIHSYIFLPVFESNSGGITDILLNSDKTRKELLYSVNYKKIIDLIMYISNGDMVVCNYRRNGEDFELVDTIYKSSLSLEAID